MTDNHNEHLLLYRSEFLHQMSDTKRIGKNLQTIRLVFILIHFGSLPFILMPMKCYVKDKQMLAYG